MYEAFVFFVPVYIWDVIIMHDDMIKIEFSGKLNTESVKENKERINIFNRKYVIACNSKRGLHHTAPE